MHRTGYERRTLPHSPAKSHVGLHLFDPLSAEVAHDRNSGRLERNLRIDPMEWVCQSVKVYDKPRLLYVAGTVLELTLLRLMADVSTESRVLLQDQPLLKVVGLVVMGELEIQTMLKCEKSSGPSETAPTRCRQAGWQAGRLASWRLPSKNPHSWFEADFPGS